MKRLPSGLGWKLLIFVSEFWKLLPKEIKLYRFVHIDSSEFARLDSKAFWASLGVGDRLIEVHRRHMEAFPFPSLEDLVKLFAAEATRHNCCDEL